MGFELNLTLSPTGCDLEFVTVSLRPHSISVKQG